MAWLGGEGESGFGALEVESRRSDWWKSGKTVLKRDRLKGVEAEIEGKKEGRGGSGRLGKFGEENSLRGIGVELERRKEVAGDIWFGVAGNDGVEGRGDRVV
ncbi:hypothetical protein COLO4_05713 [Corchorus olitorius]|uniref:Uncharacterized protein n=1 Tax=Corchorus olitorius TaxID=93759 RepID=A0A1R3KQ22_9ROSI|nr:hypothetical protein COLO4_05713 [Corchorus olitorius]